MSPTEASAGVIRYLELHDSCLSAFEFTAQSAVLVLVPAYIHRWEYKDASRSGTGWSGGVEITVVGLNSMDQAITLPSPCDLVTGSLTLPDETLENLIPLDRDLLGPIELRLECGGGKTLLIAGRGIKLTILGEPTYVESLPQEFAPDARAT